MCIRDRLVGVPLGISAAVHQGSWMDNICMFIALVGVSMPTFWVALMLVILFALKLGWLPAMGIGGIQYYILPVSYTHLDVYKRQT